MGQIRVIELAMVGDSIESQASRLEAQTKRGNLELVESSLMLNLGSDLPGVEWAGLGWGKLKKMVREVLCCVHL